MTSKTPHPIDLHVGARVRMRRMQLDISQERLAEGLGLTFQQIQKYEKGMNRIGASRLATIAKLLQVSPGFFFEAGPGSDGGDGPGVIPSTAMDRFMASREGVMIAKGFEAIADTGLRSAIARFVRDVSESANADADLGASARGLCRMIKDYGIDSPLVQKTMNELTGSEHD